MTKYSERCAECSFRWRSVSCACLLEYQKYQCWVQVLFLAAVVECNRSFGCTAADGAEASRRSGHSSGVCVSGTHVCRFSNTTSGRESRNPCSPSLTRCSAHTGLKHAPFILLTLRIWVQSSTSSTLGSQSH